VDRVHSGMTIAKILEINPISAQILFRLGVRAFFNPGVANETLDNISHLYNFDLSAALAELNKILATGSIGLRSTNSLLWKT
jgi:hypothetical protein